MLTKIVVFAVLLSMQLFTHDARFRADEARCPIGSFFNGVGCADEEAGDEANHQTGCVQQEPTVNPAPCRRAGFDFVKGLDRYIRRLDSHENELYQPPDGDLSHLGYWEGDPDEGWMYEWRKLAGWGSNIHWGSYGYIWLAEDPTGAAAVDPAQVAQTILDGMSRDPVQIGLAPRPLEQNPDSMGVVGAPVWMWIANQRPTTWGPLEESATVGGITVTVTARVEDVVWDMGDGGSKRCTSPGHAYRESIGVRESPSCGYRYERTSRNEPGTAYAVSATTNWTAEWSASTGVSGTLDVEPLTSTVHARIGERQLIEVG